MQYLLGHELELTPSTLSAYLGRGDRMKQAKADAQELIDSYRAEKQQDFNNTVLAAGKLLLPEFCTSIILSIGNHPHLIHFI